MKIRDFINSIPTEDIQKNTEKQLRETELLYNEFKEAFKADCCALCGSKLDHFDEDEICLHWFTMPSGIRKKHLKNFLKEPIRYSRLETYFRWMSSLLEPIKNINDLSCEMTPSKLKEVTIKYRNIEWSLNYGQSDVDGHKNSKNANFPHFHIQITIDDRPFIRFNECHIPFSEVDIFNFKIEKEAADLVQFKHLHGEGMSIIENEKYLKEFDELMQVAKDPKNAPIMTSSVITIPEGKEFTEEDLAELRAESKVTGVPIRKIIAARFPDFIVETRINKGPGVPSMKKRNKRNKKSANNNNLEI